MKTDVCVKIDYLRQKASFYRQSRKFVFNFLWRWCQLERFTVNEYEICMQTHNGLEKICRNCSPLIWYDFFFSIEFEFWSFVSPKYAYKYNYLNPFLITTRENVKSWFLQFTLVTDKLWNFEKSVKKKYYFFVYSLSGKKVNKYVWVYFKKSHSIDRLRKVTKKVEKVSNSI